LTKHRETEELSVYQNHNHIKEVKRYSNNEIVEHQRVFSKRKLDKDDVVDICIMLEHTKLTHVQNGERYGVGTKAIQAIKNGKSWSHITKDLDISDRFICPFNIV